MKNNNAQKEYRWFGRHIRRAPVLVALALFLILSNSVIYLTAFEAHVVNVTATIERPPMMCNALSIGYWRNHEGCSSGEGESIWVSQIREMTRNFSGAFFGISGEEICQAVWTPGCPSGNNVPAKLCRARAMTLADELNLVSGRLDLDALIAGADDGNSAFDHLYLDYNSTVREVLEIVEMIVTNQSSSVQQLTEAAYVAERIYAFYEDENPDAPYCVIDPIILLSGNSATQSFDADNSDDSDSDEDDEQDEHKNGKKFEEDREDNEESGSSATTSTESEINASFAPTDETIGSETDSNSSSTEPVAEPVAE